MERERSNTALVVIITILVILNLGLVGFIVYDKVIKDSNIQEPNDEEAVVETKYDLDSAKKLVDKYFVTTGFGTSFEKFDENSKKAISVNNVRNSAFTFVLCDTVYKGNAESYPNGSYFVYDLGLCDGSAKAISYDDVNDSYKSLFGSSLEMSKSDYRFAVSDVVDYNETIDKFIFLNFNGGQDTYPEYSYVVEDATSYSDGGLIVIAKQESCTETYIQENTFEDVCEYTNFELTFVTEENNYVLKNIVKK